VIGLTGTLGHEDPEITQVYKLSGINEFARIPDFALMQLKPSTRTDHVKLELSNEDQWLQAILAQVELHLHPSSSGHQGQPIVIIAENPAKEEKIKHYLGLHLKGADIGDYVLSSDAQAALNTLLEPGQIIVASNLGGRGSDYKVNFQKAPEGLHVILAFNSDEERILVQARGRAGRAGQPGTWQQISYGNPIKHKPNLEKIPDRVKSRAVLGDMIYSIYKAFLDSKTLGKPDFESTELLNWLHISREALDNHLSEDMWYLVEPGTDKIKLLESLVKYLIQSYEEFRKDYHGSTVPLEQSKKQALQKQLKKYLEMDIRNLKAIFDLTARPPTGRSHTRTEIISPRWIGSLESTFHRAT
jgi:hypothetical protein